MDARSRVTDPSLELQQAEIRQTLMQALAIIESLDRSKGLPACVVPGVVCVVMEQEQLVFQGTEEALRHRIVVAVALPTHTRCHAEGREPSLIRKATVLRALIRVMNEAGRDAPLARRHGEGIKRQLLIGFPAHVPANHAPRTEIQQTSAAEGSRNEELNSQGCPSVGETSDYLLAAFLFPWFLIPFSKQWKVSSPNTDQIRNCAEAVR